jgi:hypothetical protein
MIFYTPYKLRKRGLIKPLFCLVRQAWRVASIWGAVLIRVVAVR